MRGGGEYRNDLRIECTPNRKIDGDQHPGDGAIFGASPINLTVKAVPI